MLSGVLSSLHTARELKAIVEALLPVPHEVLHLLAGVIVVRAAERWSPARPVRAAWLLGLSAALANEALDYLTEQWPNWADQLAQAVWDIVWTMLPVVFLSLFRSARSSDDQVETDADRAKTQPGIEDGNHLSSPPRNPTG